LMEGLGSLGFLEHHKDGKSDVFTKNYQEKKKNEGGIFNRPGLYEN